MLKIKLYLKSSLHFRNSFNACPFHSISCDIITYFFPPANHFLKTLIVYFLKYPSLFIRKFWLHGLYCEAVVLNLFLFEKHSTSDIILRRGALNNKQI